jgi:hypothetical protein
MAQDYLEVYRELMQGEAPRLRLVSNESPPIQGPREQTAESY